MYITGDKTNYLLTPNIIISEINIKRIFLIGHVLTSIIISILIGVKVFPKLSKSYAYLLDKNDFIITIVIIAIWIPLIAIVGLIIETILNKTNKQYLNYKVILKNNIK